MRSLLKHSVKSHAGFSLVEILVVVAVIGILGAMAMSTFSGSREATLRAHAQSTAAQLNAAVKLFSQTKWTISTAADADSSDDEVTVLKTLQWKQSDTDRPAFTPFFRPGVTDSTTHMRLSWTGKEFIVIPTGTTGSGLKIDQTDGDMKGTAVDLTGFTPDAAVN